MKTMTSIIHDMCRDANDPFAMALESFNKEAQDSVELLCDTKHVMARRNITRFLQAIHRRRQAAKSDFLASGRNPITERPFPGILTNHVMGRTLSGERVPVKLELQVPVLQGADKEPLVKLKVDPQMAPLFKASPEIALPVPG